MNRRVHDSAPSLRLRPEDRRRGDESLARLPVDWDVLGGARSEGFAEDLPSEAQGPVPTVRAVPGAWLWLLPVLAIVSASAQALLLPL